MDKHQVFNTHLSTQKSPGKVGRSLLEDRCLRGPPEHHCLQRVGHAPQHPWPGHSNLRPSSGHLERSPSPSWKNRLIQPTTLCSSVPSQSTMSHSIVSPLARLTRQIAAPTVVGYLLFTSSLPAMVMAQEDRTPASSTQQTSSEIVSNTEEEKPSYPGNLDFYIGIIVSVVIGGGLVLIGQKLLISRPLEKELTAKLDNMDGGLTVKLGQMNNGLTEKINELTGKLREDVDSELRGIRRTVDRIEKKIEDS